MTSFLPTTGAMSLSAHISTLPGLTASGSFGDLIPPLRFGSYYSQDRAMPIPGQPIKFSNFRGAVDYQFNYQFDFTAKSSYGQTHTVYYKSNGVTFKNPYSVIALSSISDAFVFQTKGSTTNTAATVVRGNATLSGTLAGWLDHDVTLWMQINNQVVDVTEKISGQESVKFINPTVNDILLKITDFNTIIAPKLVSKRGASGLFGYGDSTYILDPHINAEISDISFPIQSQGSLNQLVAYVNTLGTDKVYSANFAKNKSQIIINVKVVTYNVVTYPLVYKLAGLAHHERSQGNASTSFSVELGQYPIIYGTAIKFFIGPGPGTPQSGSLWGNIKSKLVVLQTPTLDFT